MALCGPSCAIPSRASTPSFWLGSAGLGGLRLRSLGIRPTSLAESSSSLGTLEGILPFSINQIPSSEVFIQPSPVFIYIPGSILSASSEPVAVGGYTASAAGDYFQDLPSGRLGTGVLSNLE